MIAFPQALTILISTKPIDMRRGIDGLTVLIAEQLQHNPQSNILFLFGNQQRNKIKGLYWDKNGFMMIYKRLERKKFYLPKNYPSHTLEITHEQLKWLLAGFDFMNLWKIGKIAIFRYCDDLIYRWMNRRSQKRSMSWEQFSIFEKQYPMPKVKIYHQLYQSK